ncbi:MAG TPA: PAS domain-containing protein, partial [Candidatus Acidoferrum sp.]|nr:PAS domain-containing protein [Candidatus Acidoferrum sp.]
ASADLGLVRAVMDQQPGFFISTLHDAGSSLHYYRTIDEHGHPAVAVAIVQHQLFISQRPELVHALFLLFLVSILISLLTVYLIRKRFRDPLARLQRGLDSTAVGDRFYMVEPSHDEELGALASSFNRMNEALWNSRLSLDAFNQRLQKISVSLMETEGFLATLIDSSPDAVLVTSPEGEVIICNRQAATIFDADSAELLGKPVSSLFARSSAQPECPVASTDEGASFESICSRADGRLLPVFVVLRPVRDKNGNIGAFLYILRDISESRNFQEMMIRLDRYYTRGEMAGDIAHEINNYLAVLSGNLELLPILQRKGDQEKIAKKFELMRSTVEKIAGFCDGLMDSGREELSIEPTDINQAVQNVLAFLKPQNKFDTVTITTSLSGEVPLVEADAGQVQQLMVNTIYNAAEALSAAAGPRTIDIVTGVLSNSKPDRVFVRIADNGPGVITDRVDWLFVKRFTTKPKGHGIGLVTCKRIIDAHFGAISYRYENGAVFQIELPVKHPVASRPPIAAVPRQEVPVA